MTKENGRVYTSFSNACTGLEHKTQPVFPGNINNYLDNLVVSGHCKAALQKI
jgi:hypothetical protein